MLRSILAYATMIGLTATAVWGDDTAAIAALEKAGASVERDSQIPSRPIVVTKYNVRQVTETGLEAIRQIEEFPAIEFLGSGDTELSPSILNALRDKPSLKRLAISYSKIPDESAKIIGSLKSLSSLELRVQNELSQQGLHEVMKLTNLKELAISDRLVNDETLDELRKLRGLRVLSIRSVFVTDAGLAALRNLQNLTTLRVFITDRVSIAGLRSLSELKLKEMEISYFDISPVQLKELRKVSNLKTLHLLNAQQLTDEDLPVLSELTELKDLEIIGSKLTVGGIKELNKSLQQCKITVSDQ